MSILFALLDLVDAFEFWDVGGNFFQNIYSTVRKKYLFFYSMYAVLYKYQLPQISVHEDVRADISSREVMLACIYFSPL